jgi:putative FmdB family regulatory protein
MFEVFQRMSDARPEACAVCGADPVERVLVPVAVHFKGSGFYSTDYGRRAKKDDGSKDGDGASAGGEKPSKSDDKKAPAATSSESSSSDGKEL